MRKIREVLRIRYEQNDSKSREGGLAWSGSSRTLDRGYRAK